MFNVFKGKKIKEEIDRIKKEEIFDEKLESKVRKILNNVKKSGNSALVLYAQKFDNIKISKAKIKVSQKEIYSACRKTGKEFLKTFEKLAENVRAFHKKQREEEWFEPLADGALYGMRNMPIDSVGVYVPGGRASYPSSVMMNIIPAQLAGVRRIALASPPPINSYVLAAADSLGISEIYKVGGAQAIGALAYGTETIAPVDKIVGPGNVYVALAKKMVADKVGIDSLAGPSDILIIADREADPKFVAADMLSQCEHDPFARAILITTSEDLAVDVLCESRRQFKNLKRKKIIAQAAARGRIFIVENLSSAAWLSNIIAPEHLEIITSSPQKLLGEIKNAGAVFLGGYSPVALGDYGAGPNHVLPTYGTARFASPLGVYDFIKRQSFLAYTKGSLAKIKKEITMMADIEGLDAHAAAVNARYC